MPELIPFGAQFSENARTFGFFRHVEGSGRFLYDLLQVHDTHGVPFDLIYIKLAAETDFLTYQVPNSEPRQLTCDEFGEVMQMIRYGAETHGLFKDEPTR